MQIKRMQAICDELEKKGSVDVKSLSIQHNVTEKTIRQDLEKMEEMGLLKRVRGGAVVRTSENSIFPIKDRRKFHIAEKKAIAQAASEFIKDGDIVILDNGSTTLELAKLIKNKRIIVIANDLMIINELCTSTAVTLYVTGGMLKSDGHHSLVGYDAIRMMQQYYANIAFIGTSSISVEKGLMTFSSEEAEVKKTMIQSAENVICLADSTKFNQAAFVRFADVKEMNTVITDKGISREDVDALERLGVKTVIA